jgi:hypothetical protein
MNGELNAKLIRMNKITTTEERLKQQGKNTITQEIKAQDKQKQNEKKILKQLKVEPAANNSPIKIKNTKKFQE